MPHNGNPDVKVYGEGDAPATGLDGQTVAILGYGYMGRTAALNLRDSGARVRIGNRDDEYAARAHAEGFEVVPLATAATDDIVFVLLPDEVIPRVFPTEIAPRLRSGSAIAFASGYSLAFDLIEPPEVVDVLLVAPRMAGESARARFIAGEGFWAYVGVEADRSGRAHQRMLGLAAGLGALRVGAIEMSAKVEATLDLFVEQSIGAILGQAIMIAFEVAREAGVPAEALVVEMYMSGEMESVFEAFRKTGFYRASEAHGSTALFGGITRTLEMDHAAMAASFRNIVNEIQSGGFARRFQEEERNGSPMLALAREIIHRECAITAAEDHVRRLSSTGRGHARALISSTILSPM